MSGFAWDTYANFYCTTWVIFGITPSWNLPCWWTPKNTSHVDWCCMGRPPVLAACASEKKEKKVASRQPPHFRRCDPWADRFNELLHPWGSRWRYNLCEFGFHQFNYHSASVKNDLCLFFTSAAHVVRHHALIWYSLTFDIREKLVFLCIYPLEATRLHGTWVKQRSIWRQVCEILKLLTNISVQPCSANATDTTVPAQQNLCHLSVHMHAHRPFIKLMHGNSDNLGKTLDYA